MKWHDTEQLMSDKRGSHKLFTLGLLEASVFALPSVISLPPLLRPFFTSDIQCNRLLTLSPCSFFSSSADL